MSGMRVIQDGLKFCADCACWAANGDDSGIGSESERKATHEGVAKFGPYLAASSAPGDDDFCDTFECDSCGAHITMGYGATFAVLGPEEWTCKPVPGAQHDGRYLLSPRTVALLVRGVVVLRVVKARLNRE